MSEKVKEFRVGAVAEAAAGLPAVIQALRHTVGKAGVTRGLGALTAVNQPGGFDCPGCAWPDDEAGKRVDFCENGAKAVADEATRRRVERDFFSRWSVSELNSRSDQWLNERGRLAEPVYLPPGASHYRSIDWDDAFGIIARELQELDSPDQAAFYTSGRASNEAAFLYQLLARRFGTNNLPDCSNLCHESSGRAMTQSLGSGKGTVSLADFERADAIFIFGQNPGSNHPRMLATLQKAKRRGAVIVTVNPLEETGLRRFRNPQEFAGYLGRGTSLADLHVAVRVNGDVAFLKGLCKAMLEAEHRAPGTTLDMEFIRSSTSGFEAFRHDIQLTDWSSIVEVSGVEETVIRHAADYAIRSERTICTWAMGMTQHVNAIANIQYIVNLLLLRGNLGRPGAGACPVRGHSNVQGDRTMGIIERPAADFLDALGTRFGFKPPTEPGLDAVGTVQAMSRGEVQVFVGLGGNYASAMPDNEFTHAAIRRCRLTVQISTKLNRSHVVTGESALILPCLGRTERDEQPGGPQFVTCENSMGMVTSSAGGLEPASTQLLSEPRIVARIAEATLESDGDIDWLALADDYDRIRDQIEAVVPGFEQFNERIAAGGRIELPHPVRDARVFKTDSGRAQFHVHPVPEGALPPGRYRMMTVRSHDQFNTTIYSHSDRYRGIRDSRWVVLMNSADMAAAGLKTGDRVNLRSHLKSRTRCLEGLRVVAYDIPEGCVAGYYPETNPLIPVDHVAAVSNTPAYKSFVVSLEPAAH